MWRSVAPLVVSVLLVGACSDGDEPDASTGTSEDGAALYEQSCASCHGADLRGTNQGPSHLSQAYEPGHHPDASFGRRSRKAPSRTIGPSGTCRR